MPIATARVKDCNGKTTGFIVDNTYQTYYTILKNIDLIDNLQITATNIIKSKQGVLTEISIKEINKRKYEQICNENPLHREIQDKFKYWKKEHSNKVMYLSGSRQTGKTTELKKFAYKNYE